MNQFLYLIGIVSTAILTYHFALRKFRKEKRLDFVREQVTQFYSPLVGCIRRIRASSELRVELSRAASIAWQKICEENPRPFTDHEKHFEPFKKHIEDENVRFPKYLLPLYDEMVDIFTKNFWLAENSTKEYYRELCRYVELWHRHFDDSIPPRVYEEVKINEQPLLPFYDNLERNLEKLRDELAQEKEYTMLGSFTINNILKRGD
jgi:hypothetical protein